MLYLGGWSDKINSGGRTQATPPASRSNRDMRYQYGCDFCEWPGVASDNEDVSLDAAVAHAQTDSHKANYSTKMPDGFTDLPYAARRRHAARLRRLLPVPPDPEGGTYTRRHLEFGWVTRLNPLPSGDGAEMQHSDGMSCIVDGELAAKMPVGTPVIRETVNLSRLTGWVIDGQWYGRKSDEDLERELQEWRAQWDAEKRQTMEENRADWAAREAALPDWIRARLERFRAEGGANFEVNGWGYELVIAELAVLYDAIEDLKPDKDGRYAYPEGPIKEYAERNGTSGNQHSMAFTLAMERHANPGYSAEGTISALSIIDGSPFYAPKEA